MKVCWVCRDPQAHTEEHHIHPQQYNGPKEGTTYPLCPTCHRLVHLQAESLCSKDPQKRKRRFIPAKHWERAVVLVRLICQTKQLSEDQPTLNKKKVMLEFPADVLVGLHKRKADSGYSNLQKYLEDFLTAVVKDSL